MDEEGFLQDFANHVDEQEDLDDHDDMVSLISFSFFLLRYQ